MSMTRVMGRTAGLVLAALLAACGSGGSVEAGPPSSGETPEYGIGPRTEGFAGPLGEGDRRARPPGGRSPGGPSGNPPPSIPPSVAPPPPGAGEGAPVGGRQRVWAWFNPGTSSSDIDGQRGIRLDRAYRSLAEGGWGAWIDEVLKPLGHPPVVLRAPFGTSRWVDRNGKPSTAFRFEDAVDVARDPRWMWLVGENQFAIPWSRYPAPVMFHVGTPDDRELTDAELRIGLEPFLAVKRLRDRMGNAEPVYVCLDHSMYFDDTEDGSRPTMSRRTALQTSIVVTLMERAGVEVLTEAVPMVDWGSTAYWLDHGVAFRPHLSTVRGDKRPVSLDLFAGLVLCWLLPRDFDMEATTEDERRRRVVEATREFGNVAVPVYQVGGVRGWPVLMQMMRQQ